MRLSERCQNFIGIRTDPPSAARHVPASRKSVFTSSVLSPNGQSQLIWDGRGVLCWGLRVPWWCCSDLRLQPVIFRWKTRVESTRRSDQDSKAMETRWVMTTTS